VTRRVLVTGASGLLGQALVAEAVTRGLEVVAVARRAGSLAGGTRVEAANLSDPATARRVVEASRAGAVVHAAARTDVDGCEQDPEAARRLHAEGTEALAAAAEKAGARFVLVSTDSVFGSGRGPHAEAGPASPVNAYARTKLEGEERALVANPAALVVRTNFFGARERGDGRSLAEWALREWAAGRTVDGFEDVRFNPLWAGHLAAALLDLAERDARGILHVAASDAATKHDFLAALARAFGVDPARVRRASQAGRPWRARRPLDTVLDVRRAEHLLGRAMPDVAAGVRAFAAWARARGLAPAVP
jgi:dTDP-4-dehydrorhamnose reductase